SRRPNDTTGRIMSASPAPPAGASVPGTPGRWRWLRTRLGSGSPFDLVFKQICQSSAFLVVVLVFLTVLLLSIQAWPAIRTLGLGIVTSTVWRPNPSDHTNPLDYGSLGGLTFIYGSVISSLLAMCIAVPLGVGTAVFLSEVATSGPVKRIGSF